MKKLDCVDSLIREVRMLRNEIALIQKPEFLYLKAAKSGPVSNWSDSWSSYHSATKYKITKNGRIWNYNCTEQSKTDQTSENGKKTNPAVIKGVKKLCRWSHLCVGRWIENMTTSKMENCAENNVKLIHICQVWSHLKAFHCVLRFDEKNFELSSFWP